MSQQGRLVDVPSSLQTLTGDTGGAVSSDGAGNINIVGALPLSVSGNPGTYTLTINNDGTLATTYTADSGSAVPAANNLNILGNATQGCTTSATGATVTISNTNASTSQIGVMAQSTDAQSIAGTVSNVAVVPSSLKAKLGLQTSNGIAYGMGTATALSYVTPLTNGQIVIGSTGLAPQAGTLTSTGGTIVVSLGAGTLNVEVADLPDYTNSFLLGGM